MTLYFFQWVYSQPVFVFDFANKAPLIDDANILFFLKLVSWGKFDCHYSK